MARGARDARSIGLADARSRGTRAASRATSERDRERDADDGVGVVTSARVVVRGDGTNARARRMGGLNAARRADDGGLTTSARDGTTQRRLRAGVEYEISNGCANAKGRAFDDFQSFLTASLRELETSHASPMLAHMVRDSMMYGKLDTDRRRMLLNNVSAALPGVVQSAASTIENASAPRGWAPPRAPAENAASTSSSSSVLAGVGGRTKSATDMKSTTEAMTTTQRTETASAENAKPTHVEVSRNSSEFPSIIVFDLETTGLSKEKSRIIELAAQSLTDPSAAFSTLVNPGRFNIPPAIKALTGITNSMVSAPDVPSFAMAAEQFEMFIEQVRQSRPGAPVLLVAHNARQFDAAFIQYEYRRLGRELPSSWRFCDTLPLARQLLRPDGLGKFSMDVLRGHYGIELEGGDVQMHRAGTDARVLADILNKMLEHPRAKGDELRCLEQFSFSLGDPGAGSLKRATAEAKSDSERSWSPGGAPGWGGGGTVSLSDGEEADLGGGWAVVDEFENEEKLESSERESSPNDNVSLRGVQKPFWAAEDPINGILPETVDFQKLVEITAKTDVSELRLDVERWKETPIDVLKDKVPKSTMKALKAEDVSTIEAVLRNCPRKYQEFSAWNKSLAMGTQVTLTGTVRSMQVRDYMRGRSIPNTILVEVDLPESEITTSDDNPWGDNKPRCKVKVWDHISKDMRAGMPIGARVSVRGTLGTGDRNCQFSIDGGRVAPIAEDAPILESDGAEIVATYAKRGQMSNVEWHRAISASMDIFVEKLPADPVEVSMGRDNPLLSELGLLSHSEAVKNIHRPKNVEIVAQARERLAFEELLLLQVALLQERSRLQALPVSETTEGVCIVGTALVDELRTELPFALTRSQESSLEEILSDMAGPAPMLRLLQGDVGCGKTVVAAMSLLAAVGAGHQGAFMAPTEVLATQHHRVLTELLSQMRDPPKVALLTGSTKTAERAQILEDLSSGKIGIIVGTHALIHEKVVFNSLGIAVVDEQHRFGVEQRAALLSKGKVPPHMLTMSATPIPRTLAMTKFGEMALSVIDEKPAGRLPIITKVCAVDEHDIAYEAMRDEVRQGAQAYIIVRLVQESGSSRMSEVKGAEEEYARLVRKYPNVRFGLLHGQLGAEEKAAALEKFSAGETQALVATSVVEVGVDVPNASIIIIEDADGFGLAALHQLRGRVGRGSRQSKCFLLHTPGVGENAESKEDRARDRLRVLEQSNNGFRIAESDLQLRGAGELFGTKQSGQQVNLFHASMSTDLYLLEAARKAAAEMISRASLSSEPLPAPIAVALETRPALVLDNAVVSGGQAVAPN